MTQKDVEKKINDIRSRLEQTSDETERRHLLVKLRDWEEKLARLTGNLPIRRSIKLMPKTYFKKPGIFSWLRNRGAGGGHRKPHFKDSSVQTKFVQPLKSAFSTPMNSKQSNQWVEPGIDVEPEQTENLGEQRLPQEPTLTDKLKAIKYETPPRDLLFREFLKLHEEALWLDDPAVADAAYNEFVGSLNGDELHALVDRLKAEQFLVARDLPQDLSMPAEFFAPPPIVPAAIEPGTMLQTLPIEHPLQPEIQSLPKPLAPLAPLAEPLLPLAPLAKSIQPILPPLQPPLTGTETPINDRPL